jgi:hypothetical protein
MGTTDGVAKFPYIREARRIKALRLEQDVSAHFQHGPTAARFGDSVASAGTRSIFTVPARRMSGRLYGGLAGG